LTHPLKSSIELVQSAIAELLDEIRLYPSQGYIVLEVCHFGDFVVLQMSTSSATNRITDNMKHLA